MKIFKIAFLLDKSNNWLESDTKKFIKKNKSKKFFFKIFYEYQKVNKYHLVFILGNTKLIKPKLLKRNLLNLTIHESDLPKNKGFSPIQYQLINKKNTITVCLLEINELIDGGDIIAKSKIKFNGTELYDEIRKLQSEKSFELIKNFLKKYPTYKKKKQTGKSNFLKKRYPRDSKLNFNKSIKENFNLMRINNNDKWPSFFNYKGIKYILKIYKS